MLSFKIFRRRRFLTRQLNGVYVGRRRHNTKRCYTQKTCLGPSLRRVWRTRSKVKGQGHQGQKAGFSADITGTGERIGDKFTRKTCLVPRSDEFEDQSQVRRPACGLCLENTFALVCVFFSEKRPGVGKFSKFSSERIHRDTDRRVVPKFSATRGRYAAYEFVLFLLFFLLFRLFKIPADCRWFNSRRSMRRNSTVSVHRCFCDMGVNASGVHDASSLLTY